MKYDSLISLGSLLNMWLVAWPSICLILSSWFPTSGAPGSNTNVIDGVGEVGLCATDCEKPRVKADGVNYVY